MINNIVLMIYPVLLLIFAFYKAKINKSDSIATDYISIEQSKMIQAIACISIIYHHITQKVTSYGAVYRGPITLFNFIGFLFTAIFFFFSGYGLITSVYSKQDYLNTFITKRLPKVLLPFWCINLLGVLLNHFAYKIRYGLTDVLSDVTGITLVNSNGWFIIEIAIIYLLFYALFSLIKNKDVALILLSIAIILIIIYSFSLGHDPEGDKSHWFRGEWWYNSSVTFIFGMLYARFKKALDGFLFKHYKFKTAIFAILSIAVINASVFVLVRYGYYNEGLEGRNDAIVTLVVQSIACIICTTFVLLLNMRITIGNVCLKYISRMSVELFLIHGYFVNRIFVDVSMPDPVRYAVILICSILCTALVSPVVNIIVDKTVAFLNPKRIFNDTLEAEIAAKKRQKQIKIITTVVASAIVITLITILTMTFGRYMFAKSEYESECKTLTTAEVGDKVLWGHFDTDPSRPGHERVSWIVINREGNTLTLLSDKGITGSYYHQKHEMITWKDSDLRALINSPLFMNMFSKYEINNVDKSGEDYFSLLTMDEVLAVFPDDDLRKLEITPYAEIEGTNTNRVKKMHQWDMSGYDSSWWWLRGENTEGEIFAPIVEIDGSIAENTKYVNKPGGAVRPVIRVTIPLE